jgi:mannose-6-phosphate isomerase-like protein (cupin superfamily)
MSEPARGPVPFKYKKLTGDHKKQVAILGRTDHLVGMIQIVKEGGENNLHMHPHTDGIWMVLTGRAHFYGEDGMDLGEFGPHEGIVLPRGTKYRFEKTGDEDLEILAMQAFDVPLATVKEIQDDRINFGAMTTAPADMPNVEMTPT